ncbi:WD40 repeat domain-containing protein [Actinokineospora fastidiosa]|nr:WD40 repeat domain-containing protein [Actinokineospora fastidiosa]
METVVALLAERPASGPAVRIRAVVAARLGAHPVIERLQAEADNAAVTPSTRDEAARVLRAVAEQDQHFAREVLAPVPPAGRVVHNVGGNHIGDIVAGGPVTITQRISNYASAHPARFAAMAVAAVLVLGSATVGGIDLIGRATADEPAASDTAPTRSSVPRTISPTMAKTFTVQGGLDALAFSPDGKQLAVGVYRASGSDVPGVVVHSVESGAVTATLMTEGGGSWISYGADGSSLAVSGNGGAGVWAATGNLTTRLLDGATTGGTVASAFVPGGSTVATLRVGDGSCALEFWDATTGSRASTLDTGAEDCADLAVDPGGSLMATFGGGYEVDIWDLRSQRAVGGFTTDGVTALAFSPTAQFVATAGEEAVALWAQSSWQKVADLRGHRALITSLAFSPDGNLLATGSKDGTVRVWDLVTRESIATLPGHDEDDDGVMAVAFSPVEPLLATADGDGVVRIWSVPTG